MQSIWEKLANKKPIMILAPMEDVTDTVFRQIILKCGRPDLFFTEFTSTDGMCSPGAKRVLERLQFTAIEHPIVAQIWGNNPDHYFQAAKMITGMGFDGIDINMGCPDKKIVKHGCCGGLINNPNLAKEIIAATKTGANSLPVSVKTRIGYRKIQTEEWIPLLLEQNLAALTVHLRTVSEMSKVPAHWEEMEEVIKLRDTINKETLIIGNGDVLSYQDAMDKYQQYGVDGIMIGRGIFQNPWLFNKTIDQTKITAKQKLELLIEHISLFHKTWGDKKPFELMKKFYKVYVNDFPNASEIRAKLMELHNAEETIAFIENLVNNE